MKNPTRYNRTSPHIKAKEYDAVCEECGEIYRVVKEKNNCPKCNPQQVKQ